MGLFEKNENNGICYLKKIRLFSNFSTKAHN